VTTLTPNVELTLEDKVDLLTEQMAVLTDEAVIQRRRRQEWDELRSDLTPIAGEAMALAGRELDGLSREADPADLISLARQLAKSAATIERSLRTLDALDELSTDLVPIASEAMTKATAVLAAADDAGYFAFARSGLGVVDKVVTSFSQEDVDRLGDNVVSILEMVKELTQPEMVALFTRMIEAIERQQESLAAEPETPPSLWALARQVRDPDVRRGMGRALNTLRAVSAETATAGDTASPTKADSDNSENNQTTTPKKGAG